MPLFRSSIALALFTLAAIAGKDASAQQVPVPDTVAQRALACSSCHGKEGRATSEGFFPRIAGKPSEYLYNQLINFREGRRQYPSMTYMVAHLSDDYLKEIAAYYSSLHPPYPPPQPANVTQATLERGRRLVMSGDPSRNLPACSACHGARLTGRLPAIPSLVGLPRDYLNAQFGAWKSGSRRAHAPDCMAQITKQLNPEEIGAVNAWLSSQPIPADMQAEPASPATLPITCGSHSR